MSSKDSTTNTPEKEYIRISELSSAQKKLLSVSGYGGRMDPNEKVRNPFYNNDSSTRKTRSAKRQKSEVKTDKDDNTRKDSDDNDLDEIQNHVHEEKEDIIPDRNIIVSFNGLSSLIEASFCCKYCHSCKIKTMNRQIVWQVVFLIYVMDVIKK